MFDVGFAELFVLAIIGLLVLGPERLPAVARTLGGFVRKARMSYNNLKRTVEAELAAAEAASKVKEAKEELASMQRQVRELGESLDQRVDETANPTPATGALPAPGTGAASETGSDSGPGPNAGSVPGSGSESVPGPDAESTPDAGSEPRQDSLSRDSRNTA